MGKPFGQGTGIIYDCCKHLRTNQQQWTNSGQGVQIRKGRKRAPLINDHLTFVQHYCSFDEKVSGPVMNDS